MKRGIGIIVAIVVVLSAVAIAAGTQEGIKTYSWRYKMTVVIDTPEGEKTGSAVREVSVNFYLTGNTHPKDYKYNSDVNMRGEAVVVDLGKRGKVFALLKGPLLGVDYGSTIPFYVFPGPPGLTVEGAEYYSQLKAEKVLEPTHYPMFVTFTDLDDPKTIVSLLDYKPNNTYPRQYTIEKNDFEKYFGKGVSLKSVTLEMTDEPVTWGVEKYLTWLPERKQKRGYLGGDSVPPYNDPTKTYLNGVEFSIGRYW